MKFFLSNFFEENNFWREKNAKYCNFQIFEIACCMKSESMPLNIINNAIVLIDSHYV